MVESARTNHLGKFRITLWRRGLGENSSKSAGVCTMGLEYCWQLAYTDAVYHNLGGKNKINRTEKQPYLNHQFAHILPYNSLIITMMALTNSTSREANL